MGWVFNAEIRSASSELLGIGDCVNFELKIVVEVDGWAWHTDTKRFQRDRERQNDLVHAEWIVLRFTWLDLSERPHHVIESIRRAVTRAHKVDLATSVDSGRSGACCKLGVLATGCLMILLDHWGYGVDVSVGGS